MDMEKNQNTVYINQPSVDSNGNLQSYTPAIPLGMICEAKGCTCSEGKDYKRKKAPKGWEDEPIFLCDYHASKY